MSSTKMSWIVVAVLAVSTGLMPQIESSPVMDVVRHEFDNTIVTVAAPKMNKPITNQRSTPLVRCYCNMPECLAASGGVQTCTTRLGCFSQLRPNLPNIDGIVTHPVTTTTTSTTTTKKTTMIPEELDVEAAMYANDAALNGAYGCLDLFLNKTCNEVLKLMEDEESEFPTMPTETSSQSSNSVSAYHCCQEDMCNDRSHVAATASNVEAALIAAFRSSMFQKDDSKVEPIKDKPTTTSPAPILPIVAAILQNIDEGGFLNGKRHAISPDFIPFRTTTHSSMTTPDTITSAPETKATTLTAVESANTEIPTDSTTKSVVVDANPSAESSPTPTTEPALVSNTNITTSNDSASVSGLNVTSTEATNVSSTNVSSTEATNVSSTNVSSTEATNVSSTNVSSTEAVTILSANISSTEATAILSTNITSNETAAYVFDTVITSSEAPSASNANITSTEAVLTINTVSAPLTDATPVVKTTAIEDSAVVEEIVSSPIIDSNAMKTSSIVTPTEVNVNENNSATSINASSIDKPESSSDKEMNITAAVVELVELMDNTATTIETPTTPMPNISEVIMSDATSTSPSAVVNTNTTEVMNSTTETKKEELSTDAFFSDLLNKAQDLPIALALRKSADGETNNNDGAATSQEAGGLSGIKSAAGQVNDSHAPADPSQTSLDVAHQKSTDDVTPPATTGVLGLTGIPQWVEGVTGILAICGVIGVTLAALAAIKIIRKTDVFENYKSVCSNPGQPCACGDGGLGSRRSRQLTSSPGVYRKTTGPVLPPPNKPNKNLYGLAYIDNTGNSTHVYTPIPVPL